MKKLGIFLADGCEEIEALTVVDMVRRTPGLEITMITINEEPSVTGAHGIEFRADALFDEVDYSSLDGVVLPGGMPGTLNLKAHDGIQKIIREFDREGKLVTAICAAPSVLGEAGLLAGREATCYPGFEKALLGATPRTDITAVTDGHFITSRGMGTAIDFSLAIIAYLTDEKTAAGIGAEIVYK